MPTDSVQCRSCGAMTPDENLRCIFCGEMLSGRGGALSRLRYGSIARWVLAAVALLIAWRLLT